MIKGIYPYIVSEVLNPVICSYNIVCLLSKNLLKYIPIKYKYLLKKQKYLTNCKILSHNYESENHDTNNKVRTK